MVERHLEDDKLTEKESAKLKVILEHTHLDVIRMMYRRFGLKQPPCSIPIKVSENSFSSLFEMDSYDGSLEWLLKDPVQLARLWPAINNPRITISIGQDGIIYKRKEGKETFFYKDARDTCIHETCHYLHSAVNPSLAILGPVKYPRRQGAHYTNYEAHRYNLYNPIRRLHEFVAELGSLVYADKRGLFQSYCSNKFMDSEMMLTGIAMNAYKRGASLQKAASLDVEGYKDPRETPVGDFMAKLREKKLKSKSF